MRKLYQVYDIKAECIIGPLMVERRDAPAIRSFTDALKDPQSLGRHPDDYQLRYLADMNDAGFIVVPAGCPSVVMTGTAWTQLTNLNIPATTDG